MSHISFPQGKRMIWLISSFLEGTTMDQSAIRFNIIIIMISRSTGSTYTMLNTCIYMDRGMTIQLNYTSDVHVLMGEVCLRRHNSLKNIFKAHFVDLLVLAGVYPLDSSDSSSSLLNWKRSALGRGGWCELEVAISGVRCRIGF